MLRVFWMLALLALLGVPASYAQAPSTPLPPAFAKPHAPGRLIDVGSRHLHLLCKGSPEGPTVIFESGLSQYTSNTTHGLAQDAIASFARVCTYDRAGLGWSDPAPADWTLDRMADDLAVLLGRAEEPGPYVVVAHSFGGLVARLFAQSHRDALAGLVLLDATSDEDFEALFAARDAVVAQLDAAISAGTPGRPVIGFPAGTSPEIIMTFTPEILRGVRTEFEALDRLPDERKRPGGFGSLGDLPLLVVRRGKTEQPPSADDLHHRQIQERLAALSTNSALVVAENSGHTVSLDDPAAVAEAVRRMLTALRTGRRMSE